MSFLKDNCILIKKCLLILLGVIFLLLGRVFATYVNVSTPSYKQYYLMDSYGIVPTNTNFVSFKLKAERDGHFGLLETSATNTEMYEINLGGWWNLKTCLRKMPSGSCIEFVHVSEGVLNESAYIEFWFSFYPAGRLRYGKITDCNNYHQWVDHDDTTNPYVTNHFAISTYSGVRGSWIFESNYDDPWRLSCWTTWSACSVTCGLGVQTRTRSNCTSYDGTVDSTKCDLPLSEDKSCMAGCDGGSFCTQTNISDDELAEKLENIRGSLILNKSELALSIRQKISAPDSRTSSAFIGYTAAIILSLFLAILVAFDLPRLYQLLENDKNKVKASSSETSFNDEESDLETIN